jgi:para-nitrobenzyl esterase
VDSGGNLGGASSEDALEIRYVFGNLAPADAYDTIDSAISRAMQDAWIAFARTGVPRNSDQSPWPRYERIAPFFTLIEDEVTSRPFVVDELTAMIHSLRTEDHLNNAH